MSFVIVDVEADGPCPGIYSMVCFGAVILTEDLDPTDTFYGQVAPISHQWLPEALKISGFSRDEHEMFDEPGHTMRLFAQFLKERIKGRPLFTSDNLAFDWQFINYYFHMTLKENPFGFSGRRIGDIYAGLRQDASKSNDWKKFRKTKHTHNPVDDAMGNAEALLEMKHMMGLKIKTSKK